MKKTYFIWLAIHFVIWASALWQGALQLNEIILASISIFFIALFLLPLFSEKTLKQTLLFCIQSLMTLIIFYPTDNILNPYMLLIHTLLMAEAVFYLPRLKSLIVMGIQLAFAVVVLIESTLTDSQLAWCGLYYLLTVMALLHYQVIHIREKQLQTYNETLINEYRKMKRQLITEEEQVRQDERILIGHEIHDSVGHKLTALLMQFEVFRLTAAEQDKETINVLKKLAEQSLEETRQAVRTFKQRDVGGLQGVIRLIRKLEMESFMKINFSVKHGAFAVPLTGEQSFAIYRAVQEALTNIMRHSPTKEAQVIFEAPGGSIFRFEVINSTTLNPFFQEGYGLKAMKERLHNVGGLLEIDHDERQFVVRGIIRLTDWSE